ncbi:site-specific DNA recombinase [Anoxybacillus voinovskiensis]|uniref:Site-specific DNA recombinase n=1 Tax=Anoxybacteroides voinovskiense TaxID=230470 RepID=A0A840DPR8_9BACL|nr:recombinase family protein [Anoxybacillus voinovskiensis]MBB4073625.1 site-specific DNA recombinase [Anoxybacillus voinovskiensis]GGJ63318.1 putative DNA recombinase [Anoxybacillus voinovskiensis]
MKAIYARVSTEESAQKGYSIAHQIEEAKKKAKTDDVMIYTDEGFSGEFLERPGLERLRNDIRNRMIDTVIVYDPDRLARNLMHQLLLDDEFRKHNVELLFVNGEYANTPEGKLFFAMRGAISEFEKAKIRERTMAGRKRKAKQGKVVKNDRIYGYDYDKQTGQLKINESEAEIVRFIFDSFVQERFKGVNGIALHLTERKIPTKTGKTVWHRQVVRQILMNETYAGRKPQNKWNTEGMLANKYRNEKVPMRLRSKDEWIYVDVPAIVSEEQFQQAQMLLDQARRRYTKASKRQYLLSGLLRCTQCGNTMTGRLMKNWGKYHREYTDRKNTAGAKHRGCGMVVRADEIEQEVWNYLLDLFNHPERIQEFQPVADVENSYEKKELERLEKEIDRARKGRKRLLSLVTMSDDDEFDLEEVKEEIRNLQQREKELIEQYNQLEQQLKEMQESKPNEHILQEAIDFFLNHKEEIDFEIKQTLIRKVVKEIRVIDKENIEIHLF